MNEESVYNLRNFASELQNVSEIGDEMSLQVIAQLAATGRNEEQIMQIMSAAADMAAETGQDIASVAQQLNATLNGNAGALARQIGAIGDLTKEELESGKAIEIVARQYKGAAAEMATVEVQLTNAWGDFKENIGRGWQNVTQPVKEFFLGVLNNINEATAAARNLNESKAANKSGNGTAQTYKTELDDATKFLDDMSAKATRARELLTLTNKELKKTVEYTEFTTWAESSNPIQDFKNLQQQIIKNTEEQQTKVDELTAKYNELTKIEKDAAEAAAAAATAEKNAADAKKRDADALEYINANKKALAEQIEQIELRAKLTGEEVDAGELYNAYLNSYIELVTKSNGLVSENNSAAKERIKLLEELAQKIKDAATAEEKLAAAQEAEKAAQDLLNEIYGDDSGSLFDKYAKQQAHIAALKDITNANEILSEQEKNAALLELDEQYAQSKKDLWQELTEEINGYTMQAAQIAQEAADLMLKSVQTESDLELAKLDEKYQKGEVSEQEYYDKTKEIKRKAAQDEYKIKMFEWTTSVLTATANIAEGVSKAIAQGGTAGLITGALVGAAGAVQIASIIASKPIPPSFYTGGVIGGMNGASMGGDNTYIHARVGEMVLNAHQQRNLWDMINGQTGRQQDGLSLTVNNTQAGRVDTDVRQQNGELIIDILDKHINKGIGDGTYDAGYAAMYTRQEGVRVL